MAKENFGSRIGIITAIAGAAVGLGNIWKFPYVVGEYGGGAFLLVYIFCILLVGMPALLSELIIGRSTGGSSVSAYEDLTDNPVGRKAGWLGIITAFIILSFYSVVAGWIMKYFFLSLTGTFNGMPVPEVVGTFTGFIGEGIEPVIWTIVFLCATAFVIGLGVTKGIERASKILMPALVLLLIGLAIYSLTLSGAGDALSYLFSFNWGDLGSYGVLMALSHSFFTLSVGAACMIVYGAYIDQNENLGEITVQAAIADTLIALTAGIFIFPIVFTAGLEPGSGPGLLFITLPAGMSTLGFAGVVVSILFFFLMFMAALSSSISLLEVITSHFAHLGYNRMKSSYITIGFVLIVATLCSLSQGAVDWLTVGSRDFMGFLIDSVDAWLLPVGALIAIIAAGWILGKDKVLDEIGDGKIATGYYYVIKYVSPILVIGVFAFAVFEFL